MNNRERNEITDIIKHLQIADKSLIFDLVQSKIESDPRYVSETPFTMNQRIDLVKEFFGQWIESNHTFFRTWKAHLSERKHYEPRSVY